jgi:hypothetical protein
MLADAVIREAGYQTLDRLAQENKVDQAAGPDMTGEKLQELSGSLAAQLKKDPVALATIMNNPADYLTKAATQMADPKKNGFFQRYALTNWYYSYPPEHLGFEEPKVSNLHREWLRDVLHANV